MALSTTKETIVMLRNLTNLFSSHSNERVWSTQKKITKEAALIIFARNQKSSPLLRLPAEIRNLIYAYLDLGGHTIEVMHDSTRRHEQLSYRLEYHDDSRRPKKKSRFASDREIKNYYTKQKRCASVQGLFPIALVCQQLRDDTALLLYQQNTFAFTYYRCNYAPALKAWISSLTARERAAVASICWPMKQARNFQHTLNGLPVPSPDLDCSALLGGLSGLRNVVLRYNDITLEGPLSISEIWQFQDDLVGFEQARIPQLEWMFRAWEFYKKLAEHGMKKQIDREDAKIDFEQTWRVAF